MPARDLVRVRNILSTAWRAGLIDKPKRLSIAKFIELVEKELVVEDTIDSIDNEDNE